MTAPQWTTACPDWESRVVDRKSLIPFEPLFPEQAQQALDVMKALRLVDVPGSPTIGECCRDWVFDFASAIFGAYDPDTGRRLIKEFFLLISKKNGKALALSTQIPTPTGWKTMGELEVGDQVFGFDGKPCNVVNTSEIFTDHDCYELTFSNGQKVVADAGHKWLMRSSREDGELRERTTTDLLSPYDYDREKWAYSFPASVKSVSNHPSVWVIGVKRVSKVSVKCISVDSPDHQFLFGETMLPTHNSSIAGGIMLTALVLNWRESGEFLILAPTVEVAQNAYNPIRDMIRRDEELQEIFQVQDHYRTVTHRITGATLKVVAADSATVSGKKAIGILVDELWLFGKNAHADNMLMEATGGLASRPEGFIIYLTTQSDKPPAGVFRAKLQYARNVRDGVINDPAFLPVLYEHPASVLEAKGHLLPENFYMTNPNYGASVDEQFLERGLQQAKQEGQEKLLTFLAKHLNVEIGLALRSDRWAGADFWLSSADKLITFERLLEVCEVICVGIDGGGLDDLLGLTVAGRLKDGKGWVTWSHAWAHTSVLERRKAESPALLDFRDQGDLTVVDRMGQDVEDVAAYVAQIQAADLLFQVGLDPAGIGALLDALIEAGVPEEKIIGVSQGWKLGGAIKTTERKLAEGLLAHAEQPLMNWCVGNARVEPRANSILITKQASGSAKIDPLMALFNAITLLSLNPPAQTKKFQMFVLG